MSKLKKAELTKKQLEWAIEGLDYYVWNANDSKEEDDIREAKKILVQLEKINRHYFGVK